MKSAASVLPQIPMVLEMDTIGPRHVVIGEHTSQVDCLAQIIRQALGSVEVKEVEILTDQEVLGSLQPTIWVIPVLKEGSLAQRTLEGVSQWSSESLTTGSAGLNALVRVAMGYVGKKKLNKTLMDAVGKWALEDSSGDHMDAILWNAQWYLLDPKLEDKVADSKKALTHPWESPWEWVDGRMPVEKRLHILFKDLTAWVYLQVGNPKMVKTLNLTPNKSRWLKELVLAPSKVEASLTILSAWRTRQSDPYRAALEVSHAWRVS